MYRANRWTASASRAIRESTLRSDQNLLKREHEIQHTLKRTNIIGAAGRGGFNIVRFAISGVIAAGATIGTAIFYAGRDDKIRNNFEEKLPFTKPVLTSIYGDKTEKKDTEEDLESILPMNRKLRGEEEPQTVVASTDEGTDAINAPEAVLEQEEEIITKEPASNNVVVITTIDDQAAISAVDLDISNASSAKKGEKKVKKKKDKKEKMKKPEELQETAENKVNEIPKDGVTESPAADLAAITASGVQAVETVTEDAPALQSGEASFVESVAEELSEKGLLEPVPELPAPIKVEDIIAEKELTNEEITRIGEIVDQTAMEVLLQTYVDKLELMKGMAIEKHAIAANNLQKYTTQLGKALGIKENGKAFEEEWKAASDLEHESQASIDSAKDSELKMQAGIETLYEMIKAARKTGSSDAADAAQDIVSKASLELIKATEAMKQANDELLAMAQADDIATVNDVKAAVTDEGSFDVLEQETNAASELPVQNVLLTYAMRKVDFLKQEMENLRIEEGKKLEKALEAEKIEGDRRTEAELNAQKELLKMEFEVILQKKEADLMEQYENEIRRQLKFQSAAHREHLTDVLQAQAEQLGNEYKESLDKALSDQKAIHFDEITKVASHLRGIESMIDSVVHVEKTNRMTRELWLAVESLSSVLNEDSGSGRTRNLMPEISSISKLSEKNATIDFVLSTIPESAAVQGVSTAEELKKRFADVKRICKRVAMVGDTDNSLWTYILSTVRSYLVFETQAKRDIVNEIDPGTISPYEILAKAQNSIDSGDIELTVKLMSLLTGLPRKLATDWIRECRAYLETKQAAEFLRAYVASVGAYEYKE